MASMVSANEIDGRIASALRKEAPALARGVIEAHDRAYPASNLRSIPYDERLRWVESWFDFFAGCAEAGEFEPWEYSHLAAISGNFEPGLPPYYRIGDCYENTLPMEGVALPFVWREFLYDPDDVRLRAVERLHDLFQAYMRANTEPLYGQVAAYEQRVVQEACAREREACDARGVALASGPIPALAEKIVQARAAVEEGDVSRALSLLTLCKLQVAELQEHAVRGGGAPLPPTNPSQMPGVLQAAGESVAAKSAPDVPAAPGPSAHGGSGGSAAVAPRPVASPRELTLLHEVAQGKTNAEIARDLGLSLGTVRNYISTLMVKLGADNRTQLVVLALQQGLLG